MTDGRHRGGHGVGDAGVGAELLERANEIAAAEEADRLSRRIDHGKLALARAQQRLHRLLHVRVGRQRGELGHHRRARRHAP